jgi:hypothetical protein
MEARRIAPQLIGATAVSALILRPLWQDWVGPDYHLIGFSEVETLLSVT